MIVVLSEFLFMLKGVTSFGTLGYSGIFKIYNNMIYSKAFSIMLLAGLFCGIYN